MEEAMIDAEVDSQKDKYLTFAIDKEIYGIDICYIREIISLKKIDSLPDCPEYLKGIINLRGNIVPVLDMRLRLKLESIIYTDRTCIVITKVHDVMIGLIVDGVSEVVTIEESMIVPPPQVSKYRFISGIGKIESSVRLLLDCNQLFSDISR
jgi:purine-binding chemotaxis protein CheW